MTLAESKELEHFRHVIAERLGLQFEEFKLGTVMDVLHRRSATRHVSPAAYVASLEAGNGAHEWRELARELTVGETYFFRNEEQFDALRELALPARMRERQLSRQLRIASIGCASGEEAYSIAIVLRETIPDISSWTIDIIGVDINPVVLEKAIAGRYSPWSLRGTPDAVRDRWFRPYGRELQLDERIRRMVRFEERNVAAGEAAFWTPASFDIVFCRNMLMYFTPQAAARVVERITASLIPGGFFFLGHAETLRGLSRGFHLLHTHGTFYYQKRTGAFPAADPFPHDLADAEGEEPRLAEIFEATGSWADTISRSSERIRALTLQESNEPGAPPRARGRSSRARSWDLTLALELLRNERYEEALALVDTLPEDSSGDPDVLVLRAVLLAHRGQLRAAEDVCRTLLALDELSAGAHYLMALCREGAQDRDGAVDHDQTAVYLDPSFAAPRLHLGLLARKAGNRVVARRELEQALALLEREDASRLLLFGGGFSREALIHLCRAELAACCGGAA